MQGLSLKVRTNRAFIFRLLRKRIQETEANFLKS